MKQTYVVERGNFIEVAIEIRMEAVVRLTFSRNGSATTETYTLSDTLSLRGARPTYARSGTTRS